MKDIPIQEMLNKMLLNYFHYDIGANLPCVNSNGLDLYSVFLTPPPYQNDMGSATPCSTAGTALKRSVQIFWLCKNGIPLGPPTHICAITQLCTTYYVLHTVGPPPTGIGIVVGC